MPHMYSNLALKRKIGWAVQSLFLRQKSTESFGVWRACFEIHWPFSRSSYHVIRWRNGDSICNGWETGQSNVSLLGDGSNPNQSQCYQVPVIHPESFQSITSEPPLVNLKNHALHRAPKHKRLLYAYIFIAPFTTPFIFVPIIPNIPFFFCVWRYGKFSSSIVLKHYLERLWRRCRAWSNYRASRAAKYLIDLLKSDTLVSTPSEELEIIYQGASQRVIASPSSAKKHSDSSTGTSKFTSRADEILLGEDEVSQIIKSFGLPKETGRGLLRAIKQARVRIHK